jgi:hypothetical protein
MEKIEQMKQGATESVALVAVLKDTLGEVLTYVVPVFCDKVQCFLPSDWLFDVQLKQSGKDVFRMGLVDDHDQKKLRCALSGAEWAAVTTAIAMATDLGAGELTNKSRLVAPRVLIPEDRAWDGRTLSSVMRGFSRYDGQVLIASTIRPKGRSPKGWKIIDMDDWLKEQMTSVETSNGADASVLSHFVSRPPRNQVQSERAIVVLHGLGFTEEQINSMSAESAAQIISGGHMASCVEFNEDGTFNFVDTKNLLIMPKKVKRK